MHHPSSSPSGSIYNGFDATLSYMDVHSTGPLAGIKVLELGNFIAGPFAGQLMGDYGADIIKIESPNGGDPMRTWGLTVDGNGLWWPTIARNKRSVVADLKQPDDLEMVRRLANECDVLLENFRPGTLAQYGLDYDNLSASNPGVIITHVSGFGQSGPRAAEPGFGSIGEAFGGIRHTTGDPDRPPARTGVSLGDSLAALFAVIGTLAALHERSQSGRGQEVDVAIYEAVAALMESSMADFAVGGQIRQRSGGRLPGVAPANAYLSADGASVVIGANADTIFPRLCAAIEQPELASDERFLSHESRGRHELELDAIVAQWTATKSADDVLQTMIEHEVPAGPVYTASDVLDDPHYLARGMIQNLLSHEGVSMPTLGVVPKFSRTPGSIRSAGPALGEHTDALRDAH